MDHRVSAGLAGLAAVVAFSAASGQDGDRLPPGLSALPAGVKWSRRERAWIHARTGSALSWVPPGTFRMGTDAIAERLHEVRLTSGFFLGRTEVTGGQYGAFCRATGRAAPAASPFPKTDAHPVVNVSWSDAQAFCQWGGVRLPTEAEWEYAARGDDERTYPWGNQEPGTTRANLGPGGPDIGPGPGAPLRDGYPYTAPVGSFPTGASPFGVLDMAGNVSEWVQDVYAHHTNDPQTDPTGPDATDPQRDRVLRGGSWLLDAYHCRTFYRLPGKEQPPYVNTDLGFRIALSPPAR